MVNKVLFGSLLVLSLLLFATASPDAVPPAEQEVSPFLKDSFKYEESKDPTKSKKIFVKMRKFEVKLPGALEMVNNPEDEDSDFP